MRVVRLTTVFCLPLITSQGYAQSGDKKAPNIICILVDDLGYGDLSCQGYTTEKNPYDKPDTLCNELSKELMNHIRRSGTVKWQH